MYCLKDQPKIVGKKFETILSTLINPKIEHTLVAFLAHTLVALVVLVVEVLDRLHNTLLDFCTSLHQKRWERMLLSPMISLRKRDIRYIES